MEKREFLMLAHPYKEKKHRVQGWFASEKMDGIRALWDGGISRGLLKREVPFANHDKDQRYVQAPVATGLWTRYGNVLHAPGWFLDQLPEFPLDGELWTDRRSWQGLSKIIKRIVPDDDAWEKVTYNIFDLPPYGELFKNGEVRDVNFTKSFHADELMAWARPRIRRENPYRNFKDATRYLSDIADDNLRPVKQTEVTTLEEVTELFNKVTDLGGEGLILRDPRSYWEPKRIHQIVKVKADEDDEGTVTGYIWGEETDKGSKLLGMLGALILDYNGKPLKLSGFTNTERQMFCTSNTEGDLQEGYLHPKMRASDCWHSVSFPIGSRVTFKYRELSDDGIPKEARFHRARNSE